jgi:hypothetical protein
MTVLPKRITRKQLQGVAAQYGNELPEWRLAYGGLALVRDYFPIRQQIGFEALSSGAYRPAHGIRALPLPVSRMLFQFLSVPGRELQFGRHEGHWREMLARMEVQFLPPVRMPLDIAEVAKLAERKARPTVNDSAMLAILYAWLRRYDQAIDRCREMQSYPTPTLAPRTDWEEQMKAFGRRLVAAIEGGNEREMLLHSAEEARAEE